MRVLMSGSAGLVGSVLGPSLAADGHDVVRLTRRPTEAAGRDVVWDPMAPVLDLDDAGEFDAVIHLAGESIASGRWTDTQKAQIRDSRVNGTRILCEALARLSRPPQVLVSASAVGYYGDRGDTLLTEDSAPGSGFLADVCRAWEGAAAPALRRGIRVAHLRFGMILSRKGGALATMLRPFRLGLGGTIGSGKQYMSWVALPDVVGVIQHVLAHPTQHGPLNTTSPQPVTNQEFTTTLGGVLHRPTLLPVPTFAARLVLGEMADELLLASTRAEPARLLAGGYAFRFPALAAALGNALGT